MKKINIGIVLMIITAVSFVIYINVNNIQKEKDIEKAKEFVDEFAMLSNKYTLLPEEYRDINKIMPKEEFDKYVLRMKNELSKYILEEQQEYIFRTYEKNLRDQYEGRFVYQQNELQIKYSEDTSHGKMVDDIIIITHRQQFKIIADRREDFVKDIDTSRYTGNVKHVEMMEIRPITTVVKKMKNGEYKVCYYPIYTFNSFLFESGYGTEF